MNEIQLRSAQFLFDMLDQIERQTGLKLGKNLPVPVLAESEAVSRVVPLVSNGEARESTTLTPELRADVASDSCGGQNQIQLQLTRAGQPIDVVVELYYDKGIRDNTGPYAGWEDGECFVELAWVLEDVSRSREDGTPEATRESAVHADCLAATTGNNPAEVRILPARLLYRRGQPIELSREEQKLAVNRFLEGT